MRLISCLLLAACAWGASYTTITDTLITADGTPLSGSVMIRWNTFQASDGTTVAGGSKRVQVASGAFSTALIAGGQYQVTYYSADRQVSRETWNLPQSVTPIRIADIRTIVPASLSATALQGVPIDATLPTGGQILQYDQVSGRWKAVAPSAMSQHAATHAAAGSDPVTLSISQIANLQTALDAKAESSHNHDLTYPSFSGAYADPAWITSLNWAKLTGVPSSFAPSAHAASHQHGGTDQIATATAAANAIPKAGPGGTLAAAWIPDLSATYSLTGHNHSGVYAPVSHTHASSDVLSAPWPVYSSGANPPSGGCTAPAIYAETTSDPDVMYHCASGTWAQIGGSGGSGLPAQSGNAGRLLTTDGTSASWETLAAGAGISISQTAGQKTVAVDSIQVPYLALNNAFLGNNTFGGTVDLSGASAVRLKTGTTPPATCTVGDVFFDTDATAGQNVYGCTATNTWTLQGDGTTAGGVAWGAITGTLSSQTDLQAALDGKQATDSDLTAIAGLSTTGLIARTGAGTAATRTATGTANEITVTNGDGVSGNPTFALADTFDISGKTSTKPIKTGVSASATCSIGEVFFDTDASAGRNLYGCTAVNTWTLMGDGGNVRSCEIHIWGSGSGQVLQDSDDEPASCLNVYGTTETITAVRCWANAGSPTVTPIITGGSSTSILTSALTCGTASWASGTLNGSPALSSLGTIDANITAAGGTATNIRLVLTLVR